MKMKGFLTFKPKLPKPKCSSVLSVFVLKLNGRCFSLKRPRFRRRRFRAKALRFKKRFSVKAFKKPNLKFKKPLRRRKLRFRGGKNPGPTYDRFGEKVAEVLSVFRSTRRSKDLGREMDPIPIPKLESDHAEINLAGKDTQIPIVEGYATSDAEVDKKKKGVVESDVCRSFKSYVAEMIGEGGAVEADVCRSFESHVAEMIVEEGKLNDLGDVEELLYCWRNLKSPLFVDMVCSFYGDLCKDLFSVDEEGKVTTSTITTTLTISEE